jgi:hypothetical protein
MSQKNSIFFLFSFVSKKKKLTARKSPRPTSKFEEQTTTPLFFPTTIQISKVAPTVYICTIFCFFHGSGERTSKAFRGIQAFGWGRHGSESSWHCFSPVMVHAQEVLSCAWWVFVFFVEFLVAEEKRKKLFECLYFCFLNFFLGFCNERSWYSSFNFILFFRVLVPEKM